MASAQDRQLKWKEEFSSKRQLKLHAQRLAKLEDVIQAKVPMIENLVQEVSNLRKELETEKRKSARGNNENEPNFMECVENLMEEIVQINLKFLVLEERIENLEKVKSTSAFISESSQASKEPESKSFDIQSSTNDDIQTKLVELEENKTCLRLEVDFIPSPVERIPEGALSPQVGTPLQDLTNRPLELDAINGQGSDHEAFEAVANKEEEAEGRNDISVLHKPAMEPGRYLPFACLCGLEFETEHERSEHVLLEKTPDNEPIHTKERVSINSNMWKSNVKRLGIGKGTCQSSHPKLKSTFLSAKKTCQVNPNSNKASTIKHVISSHVEEDEFGNPRFFCKCGKSYGAKFAVYRHIREISIQKVFTCTQCPMEYTRLCVLRRHIRNSHKVDYNPGKFACSTCGQFFENFQDVIEHRAKAHNKYK